tara:strand:+ start:6020 stop:6961 length:942 start_codon:yes stop_codon:yes gene_type:complete
MKVIGGYLNLDLSESNYSNDSRNLLLSTGRACLNLILQKEKPKKLYVPYYICDSLLEPILLNKIQFEYYSLNDNLEPKNLNYFEDGYILYINYFGIKNKTVKYLINKYKANLIVDNSQAFYEKGYKNIWSYNSARKFFGVSDGAFLFSPIEIKNDFKRNDEVRFDHLINDYAKSTYEKFLFNESLLGPEIRKVSKLSEFILKNLDYNEFAKKRLKNFQFLDEELKYLNKFNPSKNKSEIPMCYPLLIDKKINKKKFHAKKLFVPTFWDRKIKTIKNKFLFEKELTEKLIPLPIDQRYSLKEMKKIVKIVKELI